MSDSTAALRQALRRARDELRAARACRAAGFLERQPLADTREFLAASRSYGSLGAAVVGARLRHGGRPAVYDELGTVTFADLDERSNRLANAWQSCGLRAKDGVGILVRNHRGFHDAFFACAKLGARAVLLNTDFAAPQLADACRREGVRALVYDDEFADIVVDVDSPVGRWTAFGPAGADTLADLIASGSNAAPPKPEARMSFVILTSGTTGTPKGANRQQSRTLTPIGAILERVPFRSGETTVIVPPLFHSLGFTQAMLALGLGSPIVLARRFDAAATLEAMAVRRASSLIVVPSVLRRILDELDARSAPVALPDLRVVFVAGSQLGATLARRATDTLGDVVYNLYGSTEVAIATIAGPEHLRRAPDTVGPPVLGSEVRIVDEAGNELPPDCTGLICVGNAIPFEQYTGGGQKRRIGGLTASGDVGHVDGRGWLYIDGRDDSMIVSGGENVFPDEVEELLVGHDAIVEAAAIGVDDEHFGQRLRVFVVRRAGADLDADAVREHVRRNLARYKVPRDVVFVDSLPKNATGKVLKRKLADIVADPA